MSNIELPKYIGRPPQVGALKIAKVERHADGCATITPVENGYAPFRVYGNFVYTNRPKAGGYYVVNEDAFPFYLSADEFEKYYSKRETD